jgi:hypothetical protein
MWMLPELPLRTQSGLRARESDAAEAARAAAPGEAGTPRVADEFDDGDLDLDDPDIKELDDRADDPAPTR